MKNLFVALVAFSLLQFSCSSDDSPTTDPVVDPPATTAVRLKKIVETYDNGDVETVLYTYDGNKFVSVASDFGETTKYYYTGNLITKEEYLIDNVLDETTIYEYDAAGKLSKSTTGNEVDTYVYNADGTVSFTTKQGTLTVATGKVFLTNNQAYKNEVTSITPGFPNQVTTTITTFDTKLSPFKDIIGLDKIQFARPNVSDDFPGIDNNPIKLSRNGVDRNVSTFTYNANNYPATERWNDLQQNEFDSNIVYTYQ